MTDNLFGDILSDLAGAVTGGIGYAASANLNPARTGRVALRAGPRRGPRHRRHRAGQPAGRGLVGGPDARLPGRGRRPRARVARAVADFDGDVAALGTAGVTDWLDREVVDVHHPHRRRSGWTASWSTGTSATVHVLTHTLHYGTGAFEGIRAYKTARGPGDLPPARAHGAPACAAADPDDRPALQPSTSCATPRVEVVRRQRPDRRAATCARSSTWATARWASTRSPRRSTWPSPPGRGAPTWATTSLDAGVRMKISSWVRHSPNAMPTVVQDQRRLRQLEPGQGRGRASAGYDEAIMLGPDGRVSECTGENLFIVRDGVVITPPPVRGRCAARASRRQSVVHHRARPGLRR